MWVALYPTVGKTNNSPNIRNFLFTLIYINSIGCISLLASTQRMDNISELPNIRTSKPESPIRKVA